MYINNITDSTSEAQETYGISNSGLYEIAKRENWPRTLNRGKTLWSKKHVDRYFDRKKPTEEISEWYTAADIQEKFGMSLSSIYTFVSKERIPKKERCQPDKLLKATLRYCKRNRYSRITGILTMTEAMDHFNMTRDQLYHYFKTSLGSAPNVDVCIANGQPVSGDFKRFLENHPDMDFYEAKRKFNEEQKAKQKVKGPKFTTKSVIPLYL